MFYCLWKYGLFEVYIEEEKNNNLSEKSGGVEFDVAGRAVKESAKGCRPRGEILFYIVVVVGKEKVHKLEREDKRNTVLLHK